jgi:LemA protein
MRLQDELAGTENRIAVERKRYNDTLRDYNTYVQ